MGERYNGKLSVQTWKRRQRITPIPLPVCRQCDSDAGGGFAEGCCASGKNAYLYFVADGKGGHTFNTNLAVITSLCRII